MENAGQALSNLTLDFDLAAQLLREKLEAYHETAQAASEAKQLLEDHRNMHLRKGIDAKNQAERDAQLAGLVAEQGWKVQSAEADLAEARLELELARLEWDRCRYRLRLLEVAAGLAGVRA